MTERSILSVLLSCLASMFLGVGLGVVAYKYNIFGSWLTLAFVVICFIISITLGHRAIKTIEDEEQDNTKK